MREAARTGYPPGGAGGIGGREGGEVIPEAAPAAIEYSEDERRGAGKNEGGLRASAI
jgi:hypothetical protein